LDYIVCRTTALEVWLASLCSLIRSNFLEDQIGQIAALLCVLLAALSRVENGIFIIARDKLVEHIKIDRVQFLYSV
jgi:hypothetical protein